MSAIENLLYATFWAKRAGNCPFMSPAVKPAHSDGSTGFSQNSEHSSQNRLLAKFAPSEGLIGLPLLMISGTTLTNHGVTDILYC